MFFFVVLETLSDFLLFLLIPTFFGYMAVLVAIEALWLPIFEIIIGFSNIHQLSSYVIPVPIL